MSLSENAPSARLSTSKAPKGEVSPCSRTVMARRMPCFHLEGPYLSSEDGPRGAHPREHARDPDWDEFRRWQDAAGGRIRMVTLAPEREGAIPFIEKLTASGVVVAIGHTAADGAQIRAAVDAGARLSTRLGNGSHDRIKRHPNYIWEQLAEDRLAASLIFDGHHLPPAVMKAMLRAKGLERALLVSDAVATAGLLPGVYETAVGGKVELLPSGRLTLYGTPYLAGSASSLPDGIANAVRHAGVTLPEAVRLATANPARLLGLDGPGGRGSVRAGAVADLTLFRVDPATHALTIDLTVVRGEEVYRRDA
jgi:N-acetylglucosamine-6-phosphate deacetylase